MEHRTKTAESEKVRTIKGNYYILTNLLSDDEKRVVTSIVKHIESGKAKVGIQQIANENYVSTAFIMKLCKRLGFTGYSELYYMLAQSNGEPHHTDQSPLLQQLLDNCDTAKVEKFCQILHQCRNRNMFVVGAGFAEHVANYIVQRLAICGFMVFNYVHFYDFMLFRQEQDQQMTSNIEPSVIFAISQSGESETILNDVREAKRRSFAVISFTRRPDSTLAELSDLCFLVDTSSQTLISNVPNQFFGKVILAFEELLGKYLTNPGNKHL